MSGPRPLRARRPSLPASDSQNAGLRGIFCFRSPAAQVRQFHQDEAGEVSEEYVLGSARGGGPLTVEVEPTKGSSQHDSSQVLSFSLGQGTPCDLTGRPREAKVTYSCSHSDMTVLQSVREDATCKYELEMTTSLLCGDSRCGDAVKWKAQ